MTPELYKQTMRRLGSGVSVITTRTPAGQLAGFTATSLISVSLEPPLVLFCLREDSNSIAAFREARGFVANILAAGQEALSQQFAQQEDDRFRGVAFRESGAGHPILAGTLASLECSTRQVLPAGDHELFLAAVQTVHLGAGRPLIYWEGRYHGL
jgi:flavin reductase (DIM6/NTAB) family NADH-FMN oxidoreductase RutF